MKEVIQKVMVYLIIVSAMRGLLLNKRYEEYFRFFSGMIMLLLLLTPLLSVFGDSAQWYERLERNFLHMDIEELQSTIKVADGGFEKMVLKEYGDALAKEVEGMAKEEGVSICGTVVLLKKGTDGIEIDEISGKSGQEKESVSGESEIAVVETIRISEEPGDERQEDSSEEMQKFKKKLCETYALSKEKVHIWK